MLYTVLIDQECKHIGLGAASSAPWWSNPSSKTLVAHFSCTNVGREDAGPICRCTGTCRSFDRWVGAQLCADNHCAQHITCCSACESRQRHTRITLLVDLDSETGGYCCKYRRAGRRPARPANDSVSGSDRVSFYICRISGPVGLCRVGRLCQVRNLISRVCMSCPS